MSNGAYVYAILVDGVMRYIGKGRGERYRVHTRIARRLNSGLAHSHALSVHFKLAEALRCGAKVTHRILCDGMSDRAAMDAEAEQIARRDGLWNACTDTRGGENFVEFQKTKAARDLWRSNGIKTMADPINREAKSRMMADRMATAEGKAMIAASNKRRMRDPRQAAKTKAVLAAARDRNNRDPAFQAKRIAAIRAYWARRQECQHG